MNIELRDLQVVRALSEETIAYSADVWIDDALAFHSTNHGVGGRDNHRQVGRLTQDEVNLWLAANRAPKVSGPYTQIYDLDLEVERLILLAEIRVRLLETMRTHLIALEDGQVRFLPLKGSGGRRIRALLSLQSPNAIIVNDAGADGLQAAALVLSAASGHARDV